MSDDLSVEAEADIVSSRPRARRAKSRRGGGAVTAGLQAFSDAMHKMKLIVGALMLLGILLLIGNVTYSYFNAKEIRVTYQNNFEKLQNHLVFPGGETPRILIVDDISKLPPYPFFKEAQKNDVVAVFEGASLIAIYRPSIDRLVSMSTYEQDAGGPVSTTGTTQQ